MFEQPLLPPQTATIAGQMAIAAYHTMAGRDDGYGVLSIGGTHGPDRVGLAYLIGQVLVRNDSAVGNGQQLLPDQFLKIGAVEGQRQVKFLPLAGEIIGQLLFSPLGHHPRLPSFLRFLGEFQVGDSLGRGPDLDQAER